MAVTFVSAAWWERRRWLLGVVGGLLLAAAFPKLNLAGAAWVAPGLILYAARPAGSPFRIGYGAGLAFWLASVHWLLFIPVTGYPILGWLALSAYLALYPATWCWLCGRMSGTKAGFERFAWPLFCAAVWVGLEMIQGWLFTGFPWNLLGVSQYRMRPLIQIASITGVYGVSFLVVWFSVSLLLAARALARAPTNLIAWAGPLAAPLIAIVLLSVWGMKRIAAAPEPTRFLNVALVQPSIPQTMIWNAGDDSERLSQLLHLSEAALATKPDILFWPEAAVPKMVRFDSNLYDAITNLVRRHHVWLILGSDDAEPKRNAPLESNSALYYNSSFLVSPSGEIVASYRKRRLVIFGEYVPLARWLPFVKYFTPITGGFEPGERVVPFRIPRLGVTTSVLICFEDVFPGFARAYARTDVDFLVNLTNDGWFGRSAAQWQHAANALFRAVENGLPLVRCANNGLTCWVDARGGLHEVFFGSSTDIYSQGFKTAQIPLTAAADRNSTFYNRHGDWFGWSCALLGAVASFAASRWRKTGTDGI